MDSLTKNKKTNPEIADLFTQSLCLDAGITDITEFTMGSFNAVYQITLSNGARYVLKLAPHASAPVLRNETNIMQAEVDALQLIKCNTSVPVPDVFCYSGNPSCCDSPFLIMQWMHGEVYQYASHRYSEETQKNVLFELGAMTSVIHQIHGTAFGMLGNDGLSFPTWSEAFSTLFQNLLADGMDAEVSLPLDYDDLFQLEERVRPFLNDVATPCLLHGDLWLGNVLVHNEKISALLDLERALWGDPLMEYPFGLLRNNLDFLKGYQPFAFNQTDFSVQIRRALYNLYHYLIVKIEKTYRGFGNRTSDYFADQKIAAEANFIQSLLSNKNL